MNFWQRLFGKEDDHRYQPPRKEEVQDQMNTYAVYTIPADRIEIQADAFEIDEGELYFEDDRGYTHVFAQGSWASLKLITPEEKGPQR